MRCPYCSATDVKVLESRESPNEESTRRRRECENCEKRFTTYERVETIDISVIKKNGASEPFDRNKILKGMTTACQKRPVSREKIEESISRIESNVRSMDTTEVKSTKIGDLVMKQLMLLDEVAYVRFASVYKKFKDTTQFMTEINNLKAAPKKIKVKAV